MIFLFYLCHQTSWRNNPNNAGSVISVAKRRKPRLRKEDMEYYFFLNIVYIVIVLI